nr:unnamed protein product [Haemonchus contortus]
MDGRCAKTRRHATNQSPNNGSLTKFICIVGSISSIVVDDVVRHGSGIQEATGAFNTPSLCSPTTRNCPPTVTDEIAEAFWRAN